MLVRQLEEEVVKTRAHAKETNPEIKAHIESLQIENDALTREVAILKETTKVPDLYRSNHVLCVLGGGFVVCRTFINLRVGGSSPWALQLIHFVQRLIL